MKPVRKSLFDLYIFADDLIRRNLHKLHKSNGKEIKVEIYSLAYNQELMLPYFVAHYRSHFPECGITIFDNCSTDNTAQMAKDLGCIVFEYESGGELRDDLLLEIKNNCWKGTNADWVIVCDMDELLDANSWKLKEESATILRTQGWEMIGGRTLEDFNFHAINHGVKYNLESKYIAFKPQEISEMNYGPGAHYCKPSGNVHYSYKIYNLYHYKYLYLDYVIERYKMSAKRLSQTNKDEGWGVHFLTEENEIQQRYEQHKNDMVKLF